jgi:DNA-binding NarL/FixJ family response regulator
MLEAAGLSGAGVASVLGDAAGGLAAIDAFLKDLPPRSAAPGVPADDKSVLSAREIEVLRLLSGGKSNQEIADELVISLNTVRRHVSNIFDKTGVANRAEAATYAARNGLV